MRHVASMVVVLYALTGCGREAQSPVTVITPDAPAPYFDVELAAEPRVGSPTPFVITARDSSRSPVALQPVAGERVHVIAVQKNLRWLEHAHPRESEPGRYSFGMTFPTAGSYAVFALLVPAGKERQTLRREVTVGVPHSLPATQLHVSSRQQQFGAYDVRLTTDRTQPVAGQWTTLAFHLERGGVPVTTLRADPDSGHLIIVDASTENFVYAHSTDGEAVRGIRAKAHLPAAPESVRPHEHGGDNRGPDVQFHALFPVAGRYKLWAEFAPGEDHVTADFIIEVGRQKGVAQ